MKIREVITRPLSTSRDSLSCCYWVTVKLVV